MRVIRDALAAVSPAPVVVAEGANTMDNARCARQPLLGTGACNGRLLRAIPRFSSGSE